MRKIAQAAFKRQFGHIKIVGINVRQGLDFEDDTPIVDVNIIYDDNDGELTGRGYNRVRSEVHDKTWLAGKDDLGYPYINLIAKSDVDERNAATA